MIVPTSAITMTVLTSGAVPFEKWLRVVWRRVKKTIRALGRKIQDVIVHHDQDGVYLGHRWLAEIMVKSKARISYSEKG